MDIFDYVIKFTSNEVELVVNYFVHPKKFAPLKGHFMHFKTDIIINCKSSYENNTFGIGAVSIF